MARARKVRNPLALAVLSRLSERPMHPYELGRALRERGDDRSVKFNHGSLYMVVNQLADAGFLEVQATSREGQRPERTVYAVTDAGRSELRAWLGELIEQPRHEYPAFVAGLSFIAALPPSEAVELLGSRRSGLTAQQAEIRGVLQAARDSGVSELALMEEELRLALSEAERWFVDQLIARICDPAAEWTRPWAAAHNDSFPKSIQFSR